MNEVMNNILTRRSIRKFTEEPIPDGVLKDIVDAALHAPSANGRQTWKFTVILNQQVIARLAAAIGAEIGNPDYNMYHPTVLIMPSNLRDSFLGREDNSCALENIFLAAHSHGVGSVWINQMHKISDQPAIRSILDDLGVPEDHVVYGMAALGYPVPDAPVREIERIGKVTYID